MREIALHLLDIAENSVAARASKIAISVCEDLINDRLSASIQDNGAGMDAEMIARVTDPFVTSRTTRKVGLGIPLLKAAAEACNGNLQISSAPGEGTCLQVEFQHSHIDRMPSGDLPGTLLTLVVAYPEINWVFHYRVLYLDNGRPAEFLFDDQPIKDELGDIPLTEPEILAFLRTFLEEGVAGVQKVAAQTVQTGHQRALRR